MAVLGHSKRKAQTKKIAVWSDLSSWSSLGMLIQLFEWLELSTWEHSPTEVVVRVRVATSRLGPLGRQSMCTLPSAPTHAAAFQAAGGVIWKGPCDHRIILSVSGLIFLGN